MTKDQYYEMCEALGTTPDENQIPVEFSDLPIEIQECFHIYNSLQDCWDYMGGNYIGKNLNEFWKLIELAKIPIVDYKYYYEIILQVDRIRARQIAQEQKKKQKPAN